VQWHVNNNNDDSIGATLTHIVLDPSTHTTNSTDTVLYKGWQGMYLALL